MAFTLAPTAALQDYRLDVLDTVGSTNAVALERALAGEAAPLWIVSDNQVAGRGRRGRVWQAPRGNLAASLLLRPAVALPEAATLGFVAGLAIVEALEAVAPGARFELKWPNDVLGNRGKLVGILLESVALPGGGYALAVGIGVNVVGHPTDTPYPATNLRALGANCGAAELFLALSDAWTQAHALWRDGRGLGEIRARWLKRAAGLGTPVSVRTENRLVEGLFETIDEECRLVIREHDGTIARIAAGDVHFGVAATARSNT